MRISEKTYIDYNDVLIVPQRSSLDSRKNVLLSREYKIRGKLLVGTGVIAANMNTTGSFSIARTLSTDGMYSALHKYHDQEDVIRFFSNGSTLEQNLIRDHVFYTLGTSDTEWAKLEYLTSKLPQSFMPQLICLDAANGYTKVFTDQLVLIRKYYPDSVIMAGNVVTPNMVEELIMLGADIVKIGVGSGAVCETRIKTGVGVPQLSAVDECAYVAHGLGAYICADGGITCVGDICKAFCAGSDFVMIGSMFAGTDECDGEWISSDNGPVLKHHGSASREAQELVGEMAEYKTSEGKEVLVPRKGSISSIVQDIKGGIASCCTYIGATRIKDMPKCASFVKVNRTHNTLYNN
jgi:GMP reductase